MSTATSPAILGLRTLAVAIFLALAGCAALPQPAFARSSPAQEPAAVRAERPVRVADVELVPDRPAADEVRVLHEADGSVFAIFPGGDVVTLHGPTRPADVILGPFVSPADVASAAAAVGAAQDVCTPQDGRCSPATTSRDACR